MSNRTCEFCGCMTNAMLRRCCWRGQCADRIADLERAAETSRAEHAAEVETLRQHLANGASLHERSLEESIAEHDGLLAEHAAALGLATARIRELEGERDELLGLVRAGRSCGDLCWVADESDDNTEADCAGGNDDAGHGTEGLCWEHRRRAIVARIEKATKGTT